MNLSPLPLPYRLLIILRMSGNPQTPCFPWPWQSLDTKWRSPFLSRTAKARDCPFMEREGWRGTVLAALWVEGQEKETSFLESMGRARERKGRGGGGARINSPCLCCRAGTRKASSRPARSHQHPRRGVRKAEVLCVSSRPNSRCPHGAGGNSRSRLHRASLPGKRRLGWRGTENDSQARRGTRPRPSPGPPAAAGLPCGRRDWVWRALPRAGRSGVPSLAPWAPPTFPLNP